MGEGTHNDERWRILLNFNIKSFKSCVYVTGFRQKIVFINGLLILSALVIRTPRYFVRVSLYGFGIPRPRRPRLVACSLAFDNIKWEQFITVCLCLKLTIPIDMLKINMKFCNETIGSQLLELEPF